MTNTLRTIIIDDVPDFLELMADLLTEHCPETTIVGTATDIDTAYHLIKQEKPDLLILDIELGGVTCFNLLGQLRSENLIDFQLIFFTSYTTNEHYTNAFRYSALQYLHKPIDHELLKESVARAYKNVTCSKKEVSEQLQPQLEVLYKMIQEKKGSKEGQIFLQLPRKIWEKVEVQDILYLKSDENITEFHLIGNRPVKTMQHIGYYVFLTKDYEFFRIEQGCIVNLKHVVRYESQDRVIRLSNGKHLYASRQKDRELRRIFMQQ